MILSATVICNATIIDNIRLLGFILDQFNLFCNVLEAVFLIFVIAWTLIHKQTEKVFYTEPFSCAVPNTIQAFVCFIVFAGCMLKTNNVCLCDSAKTL